MAFNSFAYHLLVLYFFFSFSLVSPAQISNFKLPLKAVNLGNWLVIERWMKPSLFDEIPNNELLCYYDGTQIQLKSTKFQKYLTAENGGGASVVANRDSASGWETFKLRRIDENTFNLRVFKKQFLNKDPDTRIVAISNAGENLEPFQILKQNGSRRQVGNNIEYRVRIEAPNGLFLQVKSDTEVTADYAGSRWEDENPSVFIMTILSDKNLGGEYQLTNGYGPTRAPQVLQDHRNSYITEQDFSFLLSKGLNAVRIPVGWWIIYDSPPKPFVGGSLQALDNAFTWAQKYGIKVVVDLHALKASQNGNEHSGSRDGYKEWGNSNIQETVDVIDFLAKRYANHQSLIAIELMNEPWAEDDTGGIPLDTLTEYYRAGHNAVRKYTSNAYVILSNRLGGGANRKELLPFASGLGDDRVVIDVHFYNAFEPKFDNMSIGDNINYIYGQRASELKEVTTSNRLPLIFVEEWSASWGNQNVGTGKDHENFANAQIEVYERGANFGWAFWSYKVKDNEYWSLQQMIENYHLNL
ncbi:putative glucan 1,3-beta-glucosidase A [Morus notabilis]|uniref:Putative glucan 1,3-beta-glucosidase A n=1 Tax=Morus notabilis TaxID=981085 RepID=W9QL65_9ROSA|nr:probable glucan 1,3-beta-glucosidase A [Morus notabilis]EXB39758.1 putative glucan 1,3-beta-glucosidase A [Morus notabilis]